MAYLDRLSHDALLKRSNLHAMLSTSPQDTEGPYINQSIVVQALDRTVCY